MNAQRYPDRYRLASTGTSDTTLLTDSTKIYFTVVININSPISGVVCAVRLRARAHTEREDSIDKSIIK